MFKNKSDLTKLFPIDNYNQKVEKWIDPTNKNYHDSLLTEDEQKNKFKLFCENYFGDLSNWSQTYIDNILNKSFPNDIKSILVNRITQFTNEEENNIGYGENFRPYNIEWINNIKLNINVELFKDLKYDKKNRAIATDNLHVRILPSMDVYFYDSSIGGQGYPFDLLQESAIYIGTPLYIIGTSKDEQWSLVIVNESISFVLSKYIANVSDEFISEWKYVASSSILAVSKTNSNILSSDYNFLTEAYIGSLFPLVDENIDHYHKIIIPIKSDNIAKTKYVLIEKNNASLMPVVISPSNLSQIITSLHNLPYGWGNLYFYNDCSSELKNLFTPFGIFLPRNSADQLSAGYVVDLTDYSPYERINYLLKNGKAFLTIIYIEGHVFLYIGNDKNNPMTYQNIWGLRSRTDKNARYIIGSSVFLPLLLSYDDEQDAISLADKKYFKLIYLA
jgi:hypothetical protein